MSCLVILILPGLFFFQLHKDHVMETGDAPITRTDEDAMRRSALVNVEDHVVNRFDLNVARCMIGLGLLILVTTLSTIILGALLS